MSPKSGGGSGISRAVGWRHFVYGGAASCIAEIGTFPLDTTKTRLQVQGQQTKHLVSCGVSPIRKLYGGMFDALLRIPKEEGLRALYRGISPALLRQSIYGTLKFGFYYSLKKVLPEEHVASNMVCAVIAGMVSSAIANPTDVLKVRMQVASNEAGSRSSLFTSFSKIYKFEGLGGLWRGVGPTSQRAGIIAAVELPVYDGCKKYFINMNLMDDTPPNHIASSFIASFTAVIASTPIDVIRTRLMSQKMQQHLPMGNIPGMSSASRISTSASAESVGNFAGAGGAVNCSGGDVRTVTTLSSDVKGKIYKSSWECFRVTLKHEGLRALYKGFIPAWLRMGPWNLIFFTSYEQLLRLY